MRHIAIIGSGPAGYYTAEAAIKQWGEDIRVDVFDRLPVPYGLIRTGVAPDHQTIKAVSRRYEKTALTENVRFVGNIAIGKDVSLAELQALYDAVIIATGAPHDRDLGIPGDDLPGVIGSASFVGWYNGHPSFTNLDPDLSGRRAVVIGNGNVALDIARIISKTRSEFAGSDIVAYALDAIEGSRLDEIVLLGRRGPHQIAMTPKELGELRDLARAAPFVDPDDLPPVIEDEALEPGQRKSVQWLRQFAAEPSSKPVRITFDFFARPVRILGTDSVKGVEVERTIVTGNRLEGTGEYYMIPCHLVISAIGYRSAPLPGAPFDEAAGRFANDDGRISVSPEAGGLYCVGWARRGPTGTIGTNKPDGFAIIAKLAEDIASGAIGPEGKAGRPGFDALAAERKLDVVTFRDWQKIEEAEIAAARSGAPREKFTLVEEMIRAGR